MTGKRFVLSKCLGGIERNSTRHIIGAEATTLLYGVRCNPKLNPKEGRMVSSKHFVNFNINCFVYCLYSSHHNTMNCLALVARVSFYMSRLSLFWSLHKMGGAVASWLVRSTPDWAVRFRALAGDIVLCSWARHFTLTVPLSTQVYNWRI